LHRGLAVERHRRSLQDLARRLSLSARRVPLPPELLAQIESRRPFPPHIAFLEKRYAAEPYRLLLSLLAADLEDASKDDMVARLLSSAPHVTRLHTEAFTAQLNLVARAVPRRLAAGTLRDVRRQFDIFGFHAARLDVREESGRLAAALGEILRGLKINFDFEEGTDRARTATLRQLFSAATPSLAPRPGVTAETAETWALFQLLARAREVYGRDLLGPFIISMTRGPADVLTVLLLARWAGCEEGLQIVPLFETLDDLDAAPRILAELFSLDIYRTHLATCGGEQIVMIGYSDSNKDGGYVAANWALYQAQENIAQTCREHGIKLTLFHGRGGTVARGGGPANRAIRAQPPGTVNGRFRLTEQGEILAARYADPDIAHRHLEQIVNAVLLASLPSPSGNGDGGGGEISAEWRDAMAAMAVSARAAYHSLVYETPGFIEYWQTATPVDEISRLRIGSRPAARRGGALQVTHIRAIPWVFSWMQSRFNLPGWYGLGTALKPPTSTLQLPPSNLQSPSPEILRDMYAHWPFFRAILDNAEMSLLKADLGIAALYSELVPDRKLADAIFSRIRDEYERARDAVLAVSGHSALMENEPVIQRSVQLRNPYVDPLNYLQIEMLRRLRALPDPNSAAAEPLREVIVLTINGIAAGLRNTG
ncbi:MAG: phosphoenolpyruvate carboxylase, partial [Chloroflexota bacterium]